MFPQPPIAPARRQGPALLPRLSHPPGPRGAAEGGAAPGDAALAAGGGTGGGEGRGRRRDVRDGSGPHSRGHVKWHNSVGKNGKKMWIQWDLPSGSGTK